MSKNKSNKDKEASLGLLIFLFFVFPPAAFLLVIFKFILPAIGDLLRDLGFLPKKKNRYASYENKEETVFEKVMNDTSGSDLKSGEEKTSGTSSDKDKTTKKKQKIPYRTASIVLLILGGLFLFSGLVDGISMLTHLTTIGVSAEEVASTVSLLAIGGIFSGVGIHLQNKVKTIRRYLSVIGKRNVVKLDELKRSFSVSSSKVRKELQSVIDSGVFGEYAYIDYGDDIFLRDSSFKPEEKVSDMKNDTVIETGADEYETTIIKIRRLNDKIKDKAVSDKIDLIEQYTGRIFEYVKKNPEKEKNVHLFMTYYLPTTLKLLESYSEIERVGVAGDNMKSAKESIENTLDMLCEAFKKLLDQLYESDNMDIASDIDVLEQMMKKDGLTGSGFGTE